MSKNIVVRLENLKKSYSMGKVTVPALNGLSYDFEEGFTVVAGPSGSGKSTLLNIVGCLDNPTEGTVYLGGKDITKLKEAEKSELRRSFIGFIFQSFSLLPVLSVFDNVEYPILRSKISKKERQNQVLRLLQEVGLEDYTHRFPKELSGGQMQRVAIARALVANPKLIIADEPTANLDSVTGEKIIQLLGRMQEEHGASIIIASHDGNVLSRFKKLLYIKDGVISHENH